MSAWSLPTLLSGLHEDIQSRLGIARKSFEHPVTKGDASERIWIELLNNYLPRRYQAAKAHVVDSRGAFSEQIDIVIFDRQYSPPIFKFEDQMFIPAESVYAAFEAKQAINAQQVAYAQQKISSVRRLFRTSMQIPHAGGTFAPKPPPPILGGIVTFESDWSPPLGGALLTALGNDTADGRIDIGCVAAHGHFALEAAYGQYVLVEGGKPATAFLLRLISSLQALGTVPMVDMNAYAQWLSK